MPKTLGSETKLAFIKGWRKVLCYESGNKQLQNTRLTGMNKHNDESIGIVNYNNRQS